MLGFGKYSYERITWFVNFDAENFKPCTVVRYADDSTLSAPATVLFNLSPFKTQCRLYVCCYDKQADFKFWIFRGQDSLKSVVERMVFDYGKGHDATKELRVYKAWVNEDNYNIWDIIGEVDIKSILH